MKRVAAILLLLCGCGPCETAESVSVDMDALRAAMKCYMSPEPVVVVETFASGVVPVRQRTVPVTPVIEQEVIQKLDIEPVPIEEPVLAEVDPPANDTLPEDNPKQGLSSPFRVGELPPADVSLLPEGEGDPLAVADTLDEEVVMGAVEMEDIPATQTIDVLTWRGFHEDALSFCAPCNWNHDSLRYMDENSKWIVDDIQKNGNAHIRIVDLDTPEGRRLEKWYRPRMAEWFLANGVQDMNMGGPYMVCLVDGEIYNIHVGRIPGSSPTSNEALLYVRNFFYSGRSMEELNRLRAELKEPLTMERVAGLFSRYSAEIDMPSVIDQIAPGGRFKVGDSATIIVPLTVTPEFGDRSILLHDDNVMMKYKFGLIGGTLKVKYMQFSRDGRTMYLGVVGLPDMPVRLNWGSR